MADARPGNAMTSVVAASARYTKCRMRGRGPIAAPFLKVSGSGESRQVAPGRARVRTARRESGHGTERTKSVVDGGMCFCRDATLSVSPGAPRLEREIY